jgi:GntR family transcriptional regulator of abcA and norABC
MKKYKVALASIEKYILDNELSKGARLPSVREFAENLNVSRHTVYTALEELICRSVVFSRNKKGYYLSDSGWDKISAGSIGWKQYLDNGWLQLDIDESELLASKKELTLAEFRIGGHLGAQEALKDALALCMKDPEFLSREDLDPKGIHELRKVVCAHVSQFGIKATPDDVLITSGNSMSLNIIQLTLLRAGDQFICDKIITERTKPFFASRGINIIHAPMDNEGIIPDGIIPFIKKSRHRRSILCSSVGAVNPYAEGVNRGNPGPARRAALLQVCTAAGVPFIEIDKHRDFLNEDAPKAVKAIDNNDVVIYMGSLTTAFTDTFRLGWIIANKKLTDKFAIVRKRLFGRHNTLTQGVGIGMLRSGIYTRYMVKVRENLEEGKIVADRIFTKYLKHLASWHINTCGFYAYIEFFPEVDVREMHRQQMYYVPFMPLYQFDKDFERHIIVCIPSLPFDKLEQAVKLLAAMAENSIKPATSQQWK